MHKPSSGPVDKKDAEFELVEEVSGIVFEYDYPQKKKEEPKKEDDWINKQYYELLYFNAILHFY